MRGGGADHTSASGFRSCQTPAQAWARSWQATARESLQGSSLQPAQEMAAGTLLSQDLRLTEDGQVPMVPGTARMFEVRSQNLHAAASSLTAGALFFQASCPKPASLPLPALPFPARLR